MKIRSPVILKRSSHGCRARDVTTGKIGRIAPPLLYPRREYLRSSDCTWLFWFRSVGSVCLRVSTVFLFCYLLYFAKITHKKNFKARIFQFIVKPEYFRNRILTLNILFTGIVTFTFTNRRKKRHPRKVERTTLPFTILTMR